jgi:cysteine-rich repeat protein
MSTVQRCSMVIVGSLLAAWLVGCAKGDADPAAGSGASASVDCVCHPGATVECACPGGGFGTMACQPACSSYGLCEGCAGGTGGTGGSGTGGSGTGGSGTGGSGTGGSGTGGSGTGGTGTGGSGTGGTGTGGSGTGGTGTGGTGTGGTGTGGTGTGGTGTGGTSSSVEDLCPGQEIVLSGSGDDPRTGSASGDTSNLSADYEGTCATTSIAGEAVYVITPDIDGFLVIDLGGDAVTTFDSVLYVRSDCALPSSELACNDAVELGGDGVELEAEAANPYYIFVDGYTSESGPYTVNVELRPKGCGNAFLEPGEECDDGNGVDEDWCRNDCTFNPELAADACPGLAMIMTGSGSEPRVGTVVGDTTDLTSSFEDYKCSTYHEAGVPDAVVAVSSDVDGALTCHIGGPFATNFRAILSVRASCSDGDSELECERPFTAGTTKVEDMMVAEGSTQYVILDGYSAEDAGPFVLTCTIRPAQCGNNEMEGFEQCDDGNTSPNDGCDADCQVEPVGPADACPGEVLELKPAGVLFEASVSGSTTGQTHAYVGTCGETSMSPEQVFRINSGAGGAVTARIMATGTTFDSVLYVRKGACGGPGQNQIECHDSLGNGGESVTWTAPPDTEYWIFVDGAGNQSGDFELEITVDPS